LLPSVLDDAANSSPLSSTVSHLGRQAIVASSQRRPDVNARMAFDDYPSSVDDASSCVPATAEGR
jgi:hypothetical protein